MQANPFQEYIDAAERYEVLFWANKARIALSKSRVSDRYVVGELADGEAIIYQDTRRNGRTRIKWTPSTLPGQRVMGFWERSQLDAQQAKAPAVTPQDVAKARKLMQEAKRAMNGAKRQFAIAA